jgi:SAM-dependent methyltransferase
LRIGKLVVNEHFVPEPGLTIADYLARDQKTAVHHLIRYRWAEAVLAEMGPVGSILDVACGAGYGSHMLAKRFPGTMVVGGDYDHEAVAFAEATYQAPNLTFTTADVTRWADSLGSAVFDCVVSFDTIEHVEHREIMMQGLVDHLAPNGFLLLSTPVKSQNVLNPGWEHHKIEFSRWALYDFLRRYFHEVLAPDLGTLPCAEVFDLINHEKPIYLLKMNPVVCRDPIRISRP